MIKLLPIKYQLRYSFSQLSVCRFEDGVPDCYLAPQGSFISDRLPQHHTIDIHSLAEGLQLAQVISDHGMDVIG